MRRRQFLGGLTASLATFTLDARAAQQAGSMKDIEQLQKNWKALLADNADIASSPTPLQRANAEWRKVLAPAAYNVLREEGTEYPGTSPLNNEKRAGVFVCAGCSLPLFTSAMKFESGTGWPSFFTTIPGAFATTQDHKMIVPRTEYHCVKCGGHHGHVFDDGPPPTNQRWCNNGVALRFIPRTAKS
jgi:peptide-methionine (R)-S-oxide reductase